MRKRTWLVVLLLVGVLVVVLGTTSVFAQDEAVPDGEAWEEMHQACEQGDYEAMAKWQEQCHGGERATAGGMMSGGMMSGGMMGGGMMGRGTTGGMMGGGMMGRGTTGGMMGGW